LNQLRRSRKPGRPKLPRGRAKGKIVPVRFKADYLRLMNSAADKNKQTLSTWIRGTLKKALKGEGLMNTYEEQVESGKQIVRQMLGNLAVEFNEPELNNLQFKITDKDFDEDRISLVDLQRREVVAKIEENDLADSPADAGVWKRLEAQIKQAIEARHRPKV
jgi:hypothetical protein